MRGSYKILILLLGILVAMVITLTTWVYMDKPAAGKSPKEIENPSSLNSPAATIQKVIKLLPTHLPRKKK